MATNRHHLLHHLWLSGNIPWSARLVCSLVILYVFRFLNFAIASYDPDGYGKSFPKKFVYLIEKGETLRVSDFDGKCKSWQFNEQSTYPDYSPFGSNEEKSFEISSATAGDAGIYTCIRDENDNTTFEINVIDKFEVSSNRQNVLTGIGPCNETENLTFSCNAEYYGPTDLKLVWILKKSTTNPKNGVNHFKRKIKLTPDSRDFDIKEYIIHKNASGGVIVQKLIKATTFKYRRESPPVTCFVGNLETDKNLFCILTNESLYPIDIIKYKKAPSIFLVDIKLTEIVKVDSNKDNTDPDAYECIVQSNVHCNNIATNGQDVGRIVTHCLCETVCYFGMDTCSFNVSQRLFSTSKITATSTLEINGQAIHSTQTTILTLAMCVVIVLIVIIIIIAIFQCWLCCRRYNDQPDIESKSDNFEGNNDSGNYPTPAIFQFLRW
ncbi:hypothetical protein HELRODRAFT_179522 [Helobdella robusta]|uniref:Ig-like domain-containing protein n=1 Tax=Helobdella robusta TaxID=6412 RepID=T1FEU3_HELRO|nr:hypothetical protein HELRODRAFT_179522 [Helobdella robusta]ESN95196.1 hypothetical protein HELRODRAFT_179522 [Helobdella robusta]